MTVATMATDDARKNFRDLLDNAARGVETVIERYHKPTAVVVNYAEWQALKSEHTELLHRILDDKDNFVPWEDVKTQLIADGIIDG